MTVTQAVEEVGLGPFPYKLLVSCGASWAVHARRMIIIFYAIPIVVEQWKNSQRNPLIGVLPLNRSVG